MKGQEVLNQFEAKREEMYRKQLNGDFDITANDFRESFLRGAEKVSRNQ